MSNAETEKFYAYGFALYDAGRYQNAVEIFELLCANSPLEFRFWFGLGASLQETKHYEKAMKAWAMCALLEPTDPMPHLHAAECAFSLYNTEDAIKALDLAEERAKQNFELMNKIVLLRERWAS